MERPSEGSMESCRNVDVSDWTEPQCFRNFEHHKAPTSPLANIIGLLLTLFVHGIVMTAIAYASVDHQDAVHHFKFGGAALQGDPREPLTLIMLPSEPE